MAKNVVSNRELEALRRETEATKKRLEGLYKGERVAQASHVLGYEYPGKYSPEVFRMALTDHLETIEKEGLPDLQPTGKFLFEEADNLVKRLVQEYMWFRFLREKIGIDLTEPAKIRAVSLFAPATEGWGQHKDGFDSWLVDLTKTGLFANGYFQGLQGMLMVQPAMVIKPRATSPWFSVRFLLIPDKIELEQVESAGLVDVCEQAHNYLPKLVGYVRRGYAPLLSLPVLLTPQGNEGVIYRAKRAKTYYFDPEIVEDEDEDAA